MVRLKPHHRDPKGSRLHVVATSISPVVAWLLFSVILREFFPGRTTEESQVEAEILRGVYTEP